MIAPPSLAEDIIVRACRSGVDIRSIVALPYGPNAAQLVYVSVAVVGGISGTGERAVAVRGAPLSSRYCDSLSDGRRRAAQLRRQFALPEFSPGVLLPDEVQNILEWLVRQPGYSDT